jgi:hypothetical protein
MAETLTQTRPLKQFKKIYRQIGREAPKIWKQTDSKPYAGDRVADFNQAQNDAFGMIGGLADANTKFSDNVLDQVGGIAGGDGLAAGMNKPLNVMGGVATGQNQINTGGDYGQIAGQMARLGGNTEKFSGVGDYKNLMGDAGDKFYSERNLDKYAEGKYLDGRNPYLEDMIRQAQENVTNQTNARLAGSGSYGGSRYANQLGRALSDSELTLRNQNFEAENARMFQANQMMDAAMGQGFNQKATATAGLAGSRTQDLNNRLATTNAQMGALAGKTGVQGQNIQNQLGAAGQMAGTLQQGQANRLAAIGMAPAQQQASFLGGQALLGMGNQMQGQAQKETDADMNYYNEFRDQDWTQLAKLGAAGGMGSQYGNTTQTQNANFLETLLGGAAGIGGLAGGLFGTGGIF